MDRDDRELLTTSVDAALNPAADTATNDRALAALGWADMLAAEPVDAVAIVFGSLGRHAASASALNDVVTHSHPPWGELPDASVERETITNGRRAIAHQLHGLASGMLLLARDHAVDRVQFGKPIASFQAVRHKLAEVHVAVEAAGDALLAADEAADDVLTVDLARVLAGRAALSAGKHCQQVLAGIGFTRDHDFHRYLFAAIELDGLYGSTAAITKQLGRDLITQRAVPRVIDL